MSNSPEVVTENVMGLPTSPCNETYVFPMSSAQQRLWFLDQLTPGTSAYNLPIAMRVRGALDETILERSLQQTVARHEILRTTFGQSGTDSVQIVSSCAGFRLSRVDLSSLPEDLRDSRLNRSIDEEVQRGFDLQAGPLFKGILFKLSQDDHILLLNMHHIVADGWSFSVILRELGAFYESLRSGAPCVLPELPIQYADYSQWQQEYCSGEEFEQRVHFWRNALQGAPQRLDLPIAKPRPVRSSLRGSTVSLLLPEKLISEVRRFSRGQGGTLFMTFLSCFKVLLYRYTHEPDLVVGTPVANRTRAEIENLVGCFVNTAIYRTRLSGDLCFNEVLSQVREWSLRSYDYQDVPFERLVEELQPERSLDRTPIFQTLFIYQRAFIQPIELPGISFTPFRTDRKGSQTDLTFFVVERAEGLRLACEFRNDLFDASSIERLLGHYQTLLQSALNDPSAPIAELTMLTEGERLHFAASSNNISPPNSEYPQVHRLFEEQAERTPHAVALSFGTEQLTYHELNRRANSLAYRLVEAGVGPDVPVAICVDRSIEMVVAILAVFKAGGMYVPLDPRYPDDRLAFVLKDSRAELMIVQPGIEGRLRSLAPRVEAIDPLKNLPTSPGSESNLPFRGTVDDLAYVIYTSGSTGVPKGVMVTHKNVVRLLKSTEQWFGFDENDVWTLFHSFAFDFSVWEMWGALAYGGRLVVVPYEVSRSPGDFYKLLAAEGVTVLNQTPSAFRSLVNCREASGALGPLTNLRFVIFGGEALDYRILQPWIDRQKTSRPARLINMYGITETTVHVTFREISESDIRENGGSLIGKPIPDLALYILDQYMQPAPIGVPGEMYVAGAGLARGYLNRAELTAERFVENPYGSGDCGRLYKTGDLARYTENGDIEYLGRADNQVKIRGFRIELGEIEAAIGEFDDVGEAVVTVISNGDGKSLAAYFVSRSESKIESAKLRAFLKMKLPEHMIPSSFTQLEKVPLTPNGKIDIKGLPSPQVILSSDRGGFEAPKTETERGLAKIWEEIFGIEGIGIHDNFFELGGHSLMAIQMFKAVEKRFGKRPPLALLFESGTIKTLAESIAESLWEDSEPSLVPLQPKGERPPLFCFHAGGGNVLFYRDLVKYMGEERPIYGLQARRSGNRQVAHDTVEDMADYYLAEITKLQPEGPYYLCGSSFGGFLAFEAAQILHRNGQEVGLVALFDTNGPDYPKWLKETTPFKRRWFSFCRKFQHHLESLEALSGSERASYVMSRLRKVKLNYKRKLRRLQIRGVEMFYAKFRDNEDLPKQFIQLENKIAEANRRYRPKSYPGKVTLFRAEKQPLGIVPDPTLGWGNFPAELEVHEIPGHHGSIVAEPFVCNLAKVLLECLDTVEKPLGVPDFVWPLNPANGADPTAGAGSEVKRREPIAMAIE